MGRVGETYTHSQMDEWEMVKGKKHTHTHHRWAWGRAGEVGLTVNVHLECVIFAVTGTVGTEAKALYYLCGSGEREASVRGRLTQPLGEEKGSGKPLGWGWGDLLPAPSPACPLTAPSCSSPLPCSLLLLQVSAQRPPPPGSPPGHSPASTMTALYFLHSTYPDICIWLFISLFVLSGKAGYMGAGILAFLFPAGPGPQS